MKKEAVTVLISALLCLLLALPAAGAETRKGVIALEGMEETIEETLFESPLGFSFWYANERLKAYQGEADNVEGVVVSALYSDDHMILSVITEEEAEGYAGEYGVDITEQPADSRVQTELYLKAEDGQYSFCTLIAENGRFIRAAGRYAVEAAEGNARFFQRVLDSVAFLSGSLSSDEDIVSSATLAIERLPAVNSIGSSILVVYFSPDDTVRAVAYTIAAARSADLFEIVPEEAYTADDLNYFNSQARSMTEMRDSSARPAVSVLPEDLSRYDTVFLGYPIWGGQAPRIISTFLESVDLSGKTIVPFCTSNSSGIGSSDTNLHTLTDASVVWQKGTRIKKGSTAEDIAAWAQELFK